MKVLVVNGKVHSHYSNDVNNEILQDFEKGTARLYKLSRNKLKSAREEVDNPSDEILAEYEKKYQEKIAPFVNSTRPPSTIPELDLDGMFPDEMPRFEIVGLSEEEVKKLLA